MGARHGVTRRQLISTIHRGVLPQYNSASRLEVIQSIQETMPKGSGLTKALALSPELADLVGAKKGETMSRPEVVKRIWAYLKKNKLQDPDNKKYFTPDAKCEPIFGKDKILAFGMAKYLKDHLSNVAWTDGTIVGRIVHPP